MNQLILSIIVALTVRPITHFPQQVGINKSTLNVNLHQFLENRARILDSSKATDTNSPSNDVYKGIKYRYVEVNARSEKVVIYKSASQRPNTFKSTYEAIQKKDSKPPTMVTNGGMFDPDYAPHGLLISNDTMYKSLDTLTNNSLIGNFYIMPNGVFSISNSSGKQVFSIKSTENFSVQYPMLANNIGRSTSNLPAFATQSGPMLLQSGMINDKLKEGSPNKKIRSGVGIIDDTHIVFVISDDESNFFDFASIFLNVFHCKGALYLDGAISKMYMNTGNLKSKGLTSDEDVLFGPVIGVIQR